MASSSSSGGGGVTGKKGGNDENLENGQRSSMLQTPTPARNWAKGRRHMGASPYAARNRSVGPTKSASTKRTKRERSLPPGHGAMQMNVLKCQAAQARMLIARNERKYAEAMYTLELVEQDCDDEEDEEESLAAELANLQTRKEQLLKLADDSDDDEDEDDDDEEEGDRSEDEEDPRAQQVDSEVPPAPVIEAVVVTPQHTACDDELPKSAADFFKNKRAWEISVAEPVVFDALMRHQERVWAKRRDLVVHAQARPISVEKPPLPRTQPDAYHQGPLFVLRAVEKGLADVAPYLFNHYARKPQHTSQRRCPYDAAYATAQSPGAGVWDPHPMASESSDLDEVGFLESQLRGPEATV